MTIDHDGPVPLYLQLAHLLRAQILSGDLPPNRPIPAESRLQQIHGLGRDTVRKTVSVLREEGLVVTIHAKGTYVLPLAASAEDTKSSSRSEP